MGKIRLKVVGDEAAEQEQKQEAKLRKEAKKQQIKGVGLGGGQRLNTVGPTEDEVMAETSAVPQEAGAEEDKKKESRGKKQETKAARIRSKRHIENSGAVAKNTSYPLKAGIEMLRKFKTGKFDETVELHINVKDKGISGQVNLPHGTGKKLRIKIADDALIAEIENGKIDFDILVAEPQMMPHLARVAKILGPKGLMPNPKAGTISDKPAEVVEKLSQGQVSYKTEPQAPLIHMSVGKISFKDEDLAENITSVLTAIGPARISQAVLKSSMSPAVRIQL